MKAKIFLCIAVLMSVLMTGCISNRDVIISPEELDKLDSFEQYDCQTNLFIIFYKKYRIDNRKNDDSFYLRKDGSLCFIKGKNSQGTWGKIRDEEVIAEKICELKELFRADMEVVENRLNIEKMIVDLKPLSPVFMETILSEPLIHDKDHSYKFYSYLDIIIDSSSILCSYRKENSLSYINFDKNGNIMDFYFSDFGMVCLNDSLSTNFLFREYPTKEFYIWSVGTNSIFYINEERNLAFDFIYCLPLEDIENLQWKVEMTLISIKMDLILLKENQ